MSDQIKFTLPCEVSFNGQMTYEVTAREPKVKDLLAISKLKLEAEESMAAMMARVLGITVEELEGWPAQAFFPIHRWISPLVDSDGEKSAST